MVPYWKIHKLKEILDAVPYYKYLPRGKYSIIRGIPGYYDSENKLFTPLYIINWTFKINTTTPKYLKEGVAFFFKCLAEKIVNENETNLIRYLFSKEIYGDYSEECFDVIYDVTKYIVKKYRNTGLSISIDGKDIIKTWIDDRYKKDNMYSLYGGDLIIVYSENEGRQIYTIHI